MKTRKALYGTALLMSFTLMSSMMLAAQAQLLPVPLPPIDIPIVNDPPVANDDFITTDEDTPVSFFAEANDFDPDGDEIFVTSVTQPSNGVAELDSTTGAVIYTPNPDFNGQDSFTYTVSDINGATAEGNVFVTVNPVNDPPVANDDFVTTNQNTPVSFFAEANDFDPDGDEIFVTSVTQPSNGVAELDSSGAVTYTPNPDFSGEDSFTYTVSDINGATATGNVFVTVNPVT